MFSSSTAPRPLCNVLAPFLYPCLKPAGTLSSSSSSQARCVVVHAHPSSLPKRSHNLRRALSTQTSPTSRAGAVDVNQFDHLNPAPADYSSAPFTDACTLTVCAGAGGHGCISFLREKYIANGPPNGGDGGTGGSVYIQAVKGETSLHKLARRGIVKAGRGRSGAGSLKGGARGADVLITVPVGTVVREVSRRDPVEEEERQHEALPGHRKNYKEGEEEEDVGGGDGPTKVPRWRRDSWLIYAGTLTKHFTPADLPPLPRPRRSNLAALQPLAPLQLDLDEPMETPLLLAAGAMGGLGNPHFITRSKPRPVFATKGDQGMRIDLQLELKLLADVGLVGLPNAGKSTLLRAITRSRSRVGDWAFTTLTPNIGTVVLDSHVGRPALDLKGHRKEPRTHFTVADIPGLIEDAHLDRGLGLGFLRHIERAAVLAFVIDLAARDAVAALKDLWREVGEYEKIRERELTAEAERQNAPVAFQPFLTSISPGFEPEQPAETGQLDAVVHGSSGRALPPLSLPPISSKPWLVIATKADLPATQDNFTKLRKYLEEVEGGVEKHPSGKESGWRKKLFSAPVSAMNKQGVSSLPEMILRLLDS